MVRRLSEEQRAQVSQAVKECERKTTGEIIPLVVARAGDYSMTVAWCSLLLSCLFVAVGWTLFQGFSVLRSGWEEQVAVQFSLPWIIGTIALAFISSWLIARFAPELLRPFVSRNDINTE